MGLFKEIKKMIPPEEISANGGLENLMRTLTDESCEFENLIVEFGIQCFKKKLDRKIREKEFR